MVDPCSSTVAFTQLIVQIARSFPPGVARNTMTPTALITVLVGNDGVAGLQLLGAMERVTRRATLILTGMESVGG